MAHNAEFVGREFVRQYNIILNRSPENLYRFFYKSSQFEHDDIDAPIRATITADGRYGVRDYMKDFIKKHHHRCTVVRSVQTLDTIGDGIVVQVTGEISYNDSPLRPFSQTFILCAESPFHYFLSNDIFRYTDFAVNEVSAPSISTELSESSFMDDSDIIMYDVMNMQSMKLKDIIIRESQPLSRHALITHSPATEIPTPEKLTWSEEMEECEKEQAKNHAQMFQDKCILTIGNRINPNINFDETKDVSQPSTSNTNEADIKYKSSEGNNEEDMCKHGFHLANTIDPDKPFVILPRPTVIKSMHAEFQRKILKPHQENPSKSNAGKSVLPLRSESPIVVRTEIAATEGFERSEAFNIGKGMTRSDYLMHKQKSQPQPSKMDRNTENLKKTKTHERSKRKSIKTEDKSVGTDSQLFKESAADREEEKTPPRFVSTAVQCDSPSLNPFLPTTVTTIITPSTTFADLVKNQNGDDSFITDEFVEPLPSRRYSAPFSRNEKPRLQRGLSFRNDREKFPRDFGRGNRFSTKDDRHQVFVGNIPREATEDDIRMIFQRFGQIVRFRIHSHPVKSWMPRYAFVTFETIEAVQECLKKRNTFFYPENCADAQKLNVNGDSSLSIEEDDPPPNPPPSNPPPPRKSLPAPDLVTGHSRIIAKSERNTNRRASRN